MVVSRVHVQIMLFKTGQSLSILYSLTNITTYYYSGICLRVHLKYAEVHSFLSHQESEIMQETSSNFGDCIRTNLCCGSINVA